MNRLGCADCVRSDLETLHCIHTAGCLTWQGALLKQKEHLAVLKAVALI